MKMTPPRLRRYGRLKTVLINALKLLHPFMPFITEEIFCNLQEEEQTIMVSQWPLYRDDWNFKEEENATETIKEAVRAIRGVRSDMNVPPSKRAKVYVVSEDEALLGIFEHSRSFFASLGYANEVVLQKDKEGIAPDAVSAVIPRAAIYMPFADLVDIEQGDRAPARRGETAGGRACPLQWHAEQ